MNRKPVAPIKPSIKPTIAHVRPPVAPPVYRPVQRQTAQPKLPNQAIAPKPAVQPIRKPIAPPVYRPTQQQAAQPKMPNQAVVPKATAQSIRNHIVPPVYRPSPQPNVRTNNTTIQPMWWEIGIAAAVLGGGYLLGDKLGLWRKEHGVVSERDDGEVSRGRTRVPSFKVRLEPEKRKWNAMKSAGKLVTSSNIKRGGEGEMHAKVILTNGTEIDGQFEIGLHAEMAALQIACASGNQRQAIKRVVIGREPCHRCAVVLHILDLSGRVEYKECGQKEYNTWGYPALENWGLENAAKLMKLEHPDSNSTKELLNYFRTTKWW